MWLIVMLGSIAFAGVVFNSPPDPAPPCVPRTFRPLIPIVH
ncbi:hypothetical protein P3T16_006630 [Paraburkholderia sp. GAS42]